MIVVAGNEPFIFQEAFDEVQHLEFGDYILKYDDKQIVIERKTINDYWNSLKSGRLHNQLSGCDVLLIDHTNPKFNYVDEEMFWKTLNGIANHHIVWHTYSVEDIVATLRRYEQRLIEGTLGEFRLHSPKDKLPAPVRILSAFDGIGRDKAELLWKSFGTVKDFFYIVIDDINLPDNEWPKGIGVETINKVKDNLGHKYESGT